MQMSKDEIKEASMCSPSESKVQYPYGLSITLDDESLKKLGMLDALPAVGSEIQLTAKATVTSVSQNARAEPGDVADKEQRLSLQITDLETNAGREPSTEEKLYKKA